MPDLKHLSMQFRDSGDPASRSVEVVASSEAVDTYMTVIDSRSWRLDRFKANPVVLFAHNNRALPVGRAENTRVKGDKLLATIHFSDATPEAKAAWQLVQERMLNGISVGFYPGRIEEEHRNGQTVDVLYDCELYELSVVPIPANPDALVKRAAQIRQAELGIGKSSEMIDLYQRLHANAHSDGERALVAAELAKLGAGPAPMWRGPVAPPVVREDLDNSHSFEAFMRETRGEGDQLLDRLEAESNQQRAEDDQAIARIQGELGLRDVPSQAASQAEHDQLFADFERSLAAPSRSGATREDDDDSDLDNSAALDAFMRELG